jgi:hypothetical protein
MFISRYHLPQMCVHVLYYMCGSPVSAPDGGLLSYEYEFTLS